MHAERNYPRLAGWLSYGVIRARTRARHRPGLCAVHPLANERMQKEKLVRETKDLSVHSCLDLLPGDEITAAHMGTVVHRGRVTDIATDDGIFWILDDLSGGRRLLD